MLLTTIGDSMTYETTFLKALILTVTTEFLFVFTFVTFIFKIRSISLPRIAFTTFLASFATLPYLWFVLPAFISSFWTKTIVGETGIIIMELFIYHATLQLSKPKSALISLCANGISILAGLLLMNPF